MSAATAEAVPPSGIEPATSTSSLRHYWHLTLELAISQFKLRYTQSILGYVWSLLKPAMYFGITYVIFVDLFHVNDGTPNYGIQILLGIVIWTFFSECTATAMGAVAGSAGLIRKAYFPRSILVVAASLTSLFTFVINMALVIVIGAAIGQISLGVQSLAAIPLLIELYILALGIAFFLASLHVQFHDVGHLWEVFTNLLFYGSGVMFSLTYVLQRAHFAAPVATSSIPAHALPAKFTWVVDVVAANPIMQVIEDLRHALVTPVAPWTFSVVTGHLAAVGQVHRLNASWDALAPYALVIVIFVAGALTYRARARYFAQNL